MATSKFSSQRLGVFRASHFDNQFMRTLSFAVYGGSTVGECYYVASRISGGSFQKFGEFAANQFKMIYGVDTTREILETLKQHDNRGLEGEITCPLLLLAGEGEGEELLGQQRELLAKVRSSAKELRVFKEAEGADAHCMTNNLMFHNQIIFDWLTEIGIGPSLPSKQSGANLELLA